MKFIKKLVIKILGKSAYTKNSKEKLYKGEYFAIKGKVNMGDLIFIK